MSQASQSSNQPLAVSRQPSAIAGQRSTVSSQVLSRYGLIIILSAFTILGLLYDFSVPVFEKPDELKHFAVIQYIQSQHALPVVREGVYKPWDQEGTQPPLYHILAAVATSWLDLSSFEEPPRNPHYADDRSFVWRERGNNNLYLHPLGETWSTDPTILAARIARWLSLLAGLATITLTYFLAKIIFVNDTSQQSTTNNLLQLSIVNYQLSIAFPLLAAAFVAFIPQFLHVSSAITNDSLSVTLAAAALVVLALVIKQGGSMRYAMILGIILGLGAIAKLSMLYLWPLTGLVFLVDVYWRRAWLDLFKFGAIIGGLIMLLAGWWYWHNWSLYGDPTALDAHLLYRGGPLDPTPTLAEIWRTEIVGLELSFWAAFGAGQILLEPWLYNLLRWIKYIVLAGLIIGLFRTLWQRMSISLQPPISNLQSPTPNPQPPTPNLQSPNLQSPNLQSPHLNLLCLLFLWTLIIFIALLRWMQITPASWGRLLFPTLPALTILTVWGLTQLGHLITYFTAYVLRPRSHVPPTFSLVPPLILAVILFSLSIIAPVRYIQAAYAKTPLVAETDLPATDLTRLDWLYADSLRLIGYTIDQPSVQPGEWLPVTLYWQATRPIEQNYSAFVHLLTPTGESIGQANTYPDGGNWPTSMLVPGQVLPDTYHVFIPPEIEAPLATRLAFGIFDFDDPARIAKPAVNNTGQVVEPLVDGVPLLPQQWPELEPENSLVANFGGQIQLIGYDWIHQKEIKPGTQVPVTFYWETLSPPDQKLNLFIHLIDPATQTQVAGFDGPPDFPTNYWQQGYTLIDSRTLDIPIDLPPGEYELRIGWYNLDDFARLPLLDGEGDSLLILTTVVNRENLD